MILKVIFSFLISDHNKLLIEKENLLKDFAKEKENNKRLSEEYARLKNEKDKIEIDFIKLKENLEKNVKEIAVLTRQKNELEQTVSSMKSQLVENQLHLDTLIKEGENKENALQDLKNKEVQIRKIAKRYKDSYVELKKQIDEKKIDESTTENEKEKLESIKTELNSFAEENNILKKQLEQLRVSLEKEERNRSLLKEAKQRIISLQALNKELQSTKPKTNNQDLSYDASEGSYLIDVSSTEKSQQNIFQVGKDNEATFSTKSCPSSRQIALQSVKPMPATTSSEKSAQDTVRTANIKPITPSCQHSPILTTWRGTETPLASIRPMTVQGGRTGSVYHIPYIENSLVNSDTSGTAIFEINANNSLNNSTTVATVPPLPVSEDISIDTEVVEDVITESDFIQTTRASLHQDSIAIIAPRVDQSHSTPEPPQLVTGFEEDSQGSSSLHNMLPTSSSIHTVSTTQSGVKRVRDAEGSTNETDGQFENIKKSKIIEDEDVKNQVPTSSQRDQDDIDTDDNGETLEPSLDHVEDIEITYEEGNMPEQIDVDVGQKASSSNLSRSNLTGSDLRLSVENNALELDTTIQDV